MATVPDCGLRVAGDEPDQRGLARAVRPDQGGRGPLPDPERRVVKQHPAVGKDMAQVRHIDMTPRWPPPHGPQIFGRRADSNPGPPADR